MKVEKLRSISVTEITLPLIFNYIVLHKNIELHKIMCKETPDYEEKLKYLENLFEEAGNILSDNYTFRDWHTFNYIFSKMSASK